MFIIDLVLGNYKKIYVRSLLYHKKDRFVVNGLKKQITLLTIKFTLTERQLIFLR